MNRALTAQSAEAAPSVLTSSVVAHKTATVISHAKTSRFMKFWNMDS